MTSPLTDFLLARIAEDEAAAREWYGVGTVEGRRDDFWLAECEAKRRIVIRHEPLNGEAPCPDLRDLALPYADHPDYRQEWKPAGRRTGGL